MAELILMYFPALHPQTGRLVALEMVPTQIERFRIRHATAENARWLKGVLNREGRQFGVEVELREDGMLEAKTGE